jgi:hypothetical protein
LRAAYQPMLYHQDILDTSNQLRHHPNHQSTHMCSRYHKCRDQNIDWGMPPAVVPSVRG